MNNIVIVDQLLSNVDKQIVENKNDGIVMAKFESDNGTSDALKIVNLESNQIKACKVKIINNNVNKEEMDKYTFNELAIPFGPLICEKILEACALLNSQKAKLLKCQSNSSDEKSFEFQHAKIDRETSDLFDDDDDSFTTDKIQPLKEKLHSIIRMYINNDVEQIIEILLCSTIAELEEYVKDENMLILKIKEISSSLKDENKEKISDNENIDVDLYSSVADYTEEETEILKKLYSQIEHTEFGKYLNRKHLRSKIDLCIKLHPLVEKCAGSSSTDNLMEKFLELDNAVLNYLLTDETALQKKVDNFLQSEMNAELINKLGFYGMDAKMKTNNFLGNIKNQLNELSKMQTVIIALQNWMGNYSQFLSTLTAHKHHVLGDLEHIIQALRNVSSSSNTKISTYTESLAKVNSNTIPNELPINPMYPPQIIQPNSMMFQPNYLFRPNFNTPNSFLLNQNRLGFIPFFNNGFRPEQQNNINSSFLYHHNHSGLDVNELLKSNISLQNLSQTAENSLSDKTTNSEETNDNYNRNNEFINSDEGFMEKISKRDPSGVSRMEKIDYVEMGSVSSYTKEESVNEIDDYDDSTDWIDEIDENMTLPFKSEETKNKEHNEIFLENLHPDVNEKILFDIFEQFGEILSIRLMRDPDTRQSLEIAYVTYANHSAANTAFEQVNFKNIYGRKCLIKWSVSDKIVRNSTEGNVFIKNLDLSIDTEQLYHLFKSYGEIVSCKVQINEDGLSKGFAFVRYENKENAEKAIDKMNGKIIGDKVVYVGKFLSKTQREKKETREKEFTNCYVNNFGMLLDNKSLREMFQVFGEIKSAKVELDENGISKGFGFVSFFKNIDAAEAVKTLNGRIIENKTIYVGRAMKKSERQNNIKSKSDSQVNMKNNIYVNKLNRNIDDERLREEFSVFGPIKSAKVMRHEDNSSLGYGFVCFHDERDAAVAIEKMNRKIIEGQSIYVNLCQKQTDKNQSVRQENTNVNSNVSDQKLPYLMTPKNQNVPFLQSTFTTNPAFSQMLPGMMMPNQIFPFDKRASNNIKDYFGNILYPKVQIHAGNLTGKIVGMILNLDNHQINNLINNDNDLLTMIKEAINRLNEHRITGIP